MVQLGDGAGAIILGPPAPKGATIRAAWYCSIGLGSAPHGAIGYMGATQMLAQRMPIVAGSVLLASTLQARSTEPVWARL